MSELSVAQMPVPTYPSVEAGSCPYPMYEWAQRDSPVFEVPPPADIDAAIAFYAERASTSGWTRDSKPPQMYFVTTDRDVRVVAGDTEVFSSVGRTIGTVPGEAQKTASGVDVRAMIECDPPNAAVHRRLASAPLLRKVLQSHEEMVLRHVTTLIDSFIERGTCEFLSEFAARLPALVVCDIIGFPYTLVDDIVRWGQVESSGMPFLSPERQREQQQIAKEMFSYVTDALAERAEHLQDDGLSTLIRQQVERDGELNLDYLRLQANPLISAGLITSTHAVGNAMLLLLQHPDVMARVVDDPSLVTPMFEEALRLESPVQWVPRRVTQDTVLSGQTIPAGAWALLGLGAANRDLQRWSNPECFDIDRADAAQHVAFIVGAHYCLGAPLARLEAKIAFEEILRRLPGLRLAGNAQPEFSDSPSLRGLRRLDIEFDPQPLAAAS